MFRLPISQWVLTVALTIVTGCLSLLSLPANAVGSLAQVDIVDRRDGRMLPVYTRDGVHWIEGIPGHEYAIRVRNNGNGRLLTVMSVDGVNVITGETAAPSQSGYVLDDYGSTEIAGWRKSLGNTAAFYFTELPNAYATRTGRPDNVGVIGVAVFREKIEPVAIGRSAGKIGANAESDAAAPASAAAQSEGRSDGALDRREAARERALSPQLGTGYGRIEASRAQRVNFERDTSAPVETITIRYDRRENLVALGILPPPVIARRPDPFPGLRFAPDPPSR
jgi:hypothetical protein